MRARCRRWAAVEFLCDLHARRKASAREKVALRDAFQTTMDRAGDGTQRCALAAAPQRHDFGKNGERGFGDGYAADVEAGRTVDAREPHIVEALVTQRASARGLGAAASQQPDVRRAGTQPAAQRGKIELRIVR